MSERYAAVVVASCFLVGLLTVSSSVTARAAECLSGPNGQSGPGTHWRYRINHGTGQRCWYLKRVGEAARARPSSESQATPRTARSNSAEPATPAEAPAEKSSSIRSWFSSTFSAFTALGRSVTNNETNEAPANDSSAAGKQPNNERTEQKKSQQNKPEQQAKANQSKPEKEKSETARAPNRTASLQLILEAAGDKDVPDAETNLSAEEQKTAIEAVGEKEVFASQTVRAPDLPKGLEDWQRELYEEFLMWRIKQLMSM
jgi:hypothetical protein